MTTEIGVSLLVGFGAGSVLWGVSFIYCVLRKTALLSGME